MRPGIEWAAMEAESNKSTHETDPRFPSGPWVGFWIQRGFGKQKTSTILTFRDGRIDGAGGDIAGRFSFTGTYDLKTGRCKMDKQYFGGHLVKYDGVNEGEGLWLWGLWTLYGDRGGFHLWPEGENDPTEKRTSVELETPADAERQEKRVPAEILP